MSAVIGFSLILVAVGGLTGVLSLSVWVSLAIAVLGLVSLSAQTMPSRKDDHRNGRIIKRG